MRVAHLLGNLTADLDGDDFKIVVILCGVIVVLIVSGLTWIITRSMLKSASDANAQQPLVISLGALTFVALMGALITNNGDAFTLAATGMGAIAGAVTASWSEARNRIDQNARNIQANKDLIAANKKTIIRHKKTEQHPDTEENPDPEPS